MIERFIEQLEKEGKSSLTVRQYASSWAKFEGWLRSEVEGAMPGSRGDRARRNGDKTDIQFLRTLTSSVSQRQPDTNDQGDQFSPWNATQLDIANFKRWASQHYKPRTVQLNLIHLNVIFRWAVEQGLAPDNPCTNVDNVTVQQEAPKWLSRNEQNALIRTIRKNGDLRELTIVTVLLHTGLRVQELCDIKLRDIILAERKGTFIIQQGKGGKYREVPLNVDARRAIEDYIMNGRKDGSEYLFTTQRSDRMTARAVQHILQKYAKITGIEVTPHCLRHTFGHELAVRKVPLDVIARLMGHMKKDGSPNLEMVTRYTTPGREDLARAVEELSWT